MGYRNIEGLRSKTINIFTNASTTKFALQNNNELGLPSNAVIVAIQARQPNAANGRTSNGREMVSQTVWDNSYLFLKVRDENGKIDLLTQAYYLPYLETDVLFLQPVKSCFIDWNESYIEINQRALASVNVNASFELVVHYLVDCPPMGLENRLTFRTGTNRIGKRNARFEIQLQPNQQIYKISNTQNVGLPLDAFVLGFSTQQPLQTLRNGTPIGNALNSTFLTLKEGTNSFIDAYPCKLSQNNPKVLPSLNYFPIEPLPVSKIDWNQSFIQIFNPSIIGAGELFSLDLIWCK